MTCPECGGPMAERENRTTGEMFWGCQDFPDCRGTRPGSGFTDEDEAQDEDAPALPSEAWAQRDRRRFREA
jgi:ssDNA-binding Zn-finger/Zn-ribbon topoisomerase 1